MYFGVHSALFQNSQLGDSCRTLRKLGIRSLELNAENLVWAKPHVWPEMCQEKRALLKKTFKQYDITISSICSHIPLINKELNFLT